MLLRPSAPFTAVAGLVAADSATIFGALNGVNALLLQINTQLLNLDANNIAMAGPQLGMLGQTSEPSLVGFAQQVPSTTPLNAQKTDNLNAARVVLVSDLLAQKPLFDTARLSQTVADILQQTGDSAEGFFSAVTGQLAPVDTNSNTVDQFTQAPNVFDVAIAVFRGQAAVMTTPPTLPSPSAAAARAGPPVTEQGKGMIAADGSYTCMAVCPAGSFM